MTAQAHLPLSTFLLQADEPTSNARSLMQGQSGPMTYVRSQGSR